MKKLVGMLGVVAVVGCSETTALPPESEVVITATSATSLTVIAGNSVTDLPAIVARNADGSPRPGIVVHFTVIPLTASITGYTDTTNALGIAHLKGWTPSAKAGQQNVVTASIANGGSVTFSATVVAGAPTLLSKLSGDSQIGTVETQLATLPKLRVVDAYDNPIAGVHVRFEVTQGGGSVSPAEVESDALGNVSPSRWTLGAAGDQALTVSAGPLSQVFRATAIGIPGCTDPAPLTSVTSFHATLTPSSCIRDGRYFTAYNIIIGSATQWEFDMRSATLNSYLELHDAAGRLMAENDDLDDNTKDSRIRALLVPGGYQLLAFSKSPGVTGDFILDFKYPGYPYDCDTVSVARGSSFHGGVGRISCDGRPPEIAEYYRVHVNAGEALNITLRDESYSGFEIELFDAAGVFLARSKEGASYLDYLVSYVAQADMDVTVRVSSADDGGGYLISFN